tara:strand:+ start:962 stop:2200 length:1239 start_codon:yes stop_codon:yes gene_type:complete
MKIYVDTCDYFTDLISDNTEFNYREDIQIEVDGVLSPLNFLCYLFLENENKLKNKARIKKDIIDQYYNIAKDNTLVENPDEAEILYILVSNINFFRRMDEYKINKTILSKLQSGECKLFIDIPDDGWFASKINKTLEGLHSWLDDNNILQKNVYVKNMNLISDKRETEINMITSTINSEVYLRNTPSMPCKFNSIDKLFVNYNRVVKSHKLFLGYSLFQNDLVENSLIGFSDNYIEPQSIGKNYTEFNYDFNVLYNFLKELPYKIDNKDIKDLDDQGIIGQLIERTDYERTFLSLVSESTCEDGVVYLSEKTFKPIAMGHPFIIVGATGSIKKLKDIGYKTFDEFWDESYDNCNTYKERIERIIEILLSLKSKNFEELISMREQMKEITDYNFKLFNKRVKDYKLTNKNIYK